MKKIIRIGSSYPEFVTVVNILISVIAGMLCDILLELDSKDSFTMGVISMVALSLIQLSLYSLGLEKKIESQTERISDLTDLMESKLKEFKEIMHIDATINKHCDTPAIREGIVSMATEADKAMQSLNNAENVSALDALYEEQIGEILTSGKEKLQQLKGGVIRVFGNDSNRLWEQMIQNTERKFFTTNLSLIFNDNLMGAKTNKHLLALQEKVVNRIGGKNFERVFIYNDKVDKNALKNVLKSQSEIGITVRLLEDKHFKELSATHNFIEQIGCADFAVIDDNYLFLAHSDNTKRKTFCADMYRGGERLSAAKNFAGAIRKMALYFELDDVGKLLKEEEIYE